MTALHFFATDRPSLVGAPVLPMSDEDARFWRLFRERRSPPPSVATATAPLAPLPEVKRRKGIRHGR